MANMSQLSAALCSLDAKFFSFIKREMKLRTLSEGSDKKVGRKS